MSLRSGHNSSRRALTLPGLSSQQGQPVVLDGALKFAFDVFEVVCELSNSQLRLSSSRPNFHPSCTELMTEEMKLLFRNQWLIAEDLKLIYFIMNAPCIRGSDDFGVMLTQVLDSYKRKGFTRRLFVEFVFLLAFWTLVLRQRTEWVAATDFAVQLITIYTRFIMNKGGFNACKEWPTVEMVRGVAYEEPNDES